MRSQAIERLSRKLDFLTVASTAIALFFGACVVVTPASAESLEQALAATYMNNPTLNAERARLRATDEEYARARAGILPNVDFTSDWGRRETRTENKLVFPGSNVGRIGTHHPGSYAFTLTQPLFRGLRTLNGLRYAEATINAGRESLRSIEQDTLLQAVTAYVDVVRDQAIVGLRENNVKVLSEQLTATKDRFEVGEVTKTDVAQAEARRAGATSDLSLAQANLKSSRATYEQVVGRAPSNLSEPPPIESVLPNTLPSALSIGEGENPDIQQAVYLEKASAYDIKRIIGETLPELNLETEYSESFEPSLTSRRTEDFTVIGRLTVPLYSGGEPSARVRQARQTRGQRRQEIEAARVRIRAEVVSAWSALVASRARKESAESQVRANTIALNGVREEEKVGQRTILDVLDAEQELVDAQVTLVGVRRDLVVASFTLYSAVGRLDAASLGLAVDFYDPLEHYKRVRRKLFGFGRRIPN